MRKPFKGLHTLVLLGGCMATSSNDVHWKKVANTQKPFSSTHWDEKKYVFFYPDFFMLGVHWKLFSFLCNMCLNSCRKGERVVCGSVQSLPHYRVRKQCGLTTWPLPQQTIMYQVKETESVIKRWRIESDTFSVKGQHAQVAEWFWCEWVVVDNIERVLNVCVHSHAQVKKKEKEGRCFATCVQCCFALNDQKQKVSTLKTSYQEWKIDAAIIKTLPVRQLFRLSRLLVAPYLL